MEKAIEISLRTGKVTLEVIREDIIRCVYGKGEEIPRDSLIIEKKEYPEVIFTQTNRNGIVTICTDSLKLEVDVKTEIFTWYNLKTNQIYVKEAGKTLTEIDVISYTTGEEPPLVERVKTVDGERNFIKNLKPVVERKAYRGKLSFSWEEKEGIYGLGQGEEGIYNYRKHSQYLYQHNMRIPIPFFISDRCYGILADCCSLMTFNDDENGSYLFMDTIACMDYYFLGGQNFDQVIDAFRYLTGKATMLPKWAFGYIQSKEAYLNQDELVEVAARYRELQIPLDCVVQDWNTWEPGNWGEKQVDKKRFSNLPAAMKQIHDMHVHTMVSVWPNMNPGGNNHKEFFNAGHLLYDYSTYDAFSEEARAMYWKQAKEELFDGGFDSWWCDSTEPFSGPDWGGEEKREPWERYQLVGNEHKQYLKPEQANAFALMHAKGIYENQKNDSKEKRVLNLTRSGYAGSQRYGTVLWSGDTCATWKNFKIQMTEGLNFALSGMPYWTLDIGAFFTVGSAWEKRGCNCSDNPSPIWFWRGAYNDGVEDLAYRELYVRWFQYGTFLPMFRSHGTDTPREIWNFGKEGEVFYDTIAKFIRLRYRLMPYIYSLAGSVYLHNTTIIRSLLFDFLEDEKVKGITEEFMFGSSILVCPVTKPMYYKTGSIEISEAKQIDVYLPKSAGWFDYWSGTYYEGGQEIKADAPIDKMPLYIRAGSILPMMEGLQYADEVAKEPMHIQIYPGADAKFELYEDEGDNFNFEKESYSVILFQWDEKKKELCIGNRQGTYPQMEEKRIFTIQIAEEIKIISYEGKECRI